MGLSPGVPDPFLREPTQNRRFSGPFQQFCTFNTILVDDGAYVNKRYNPSRAGDVLARRGFEDSPPNPRGATSPPSAARGPKSVVQTGKTSVLDGERWRKLLDAIPTNMPCDLRNRALIASCTYFFAALRMKVEVVQGEREARPRRTQEAIVVRRAEAGCRRRSTKAGRFRITYVTQPTAALTTRLPITAAARETPPET